MCGIIGIVGKEDVVPAVIEGLRRVEYRGYDSAGIAVVNGSIERIRKEGHVEVLAEAVKSARLSGVLAIGHTRWATHGPAIEQNAHPHLSNDEVVLVHNGIVENHEELRERLINDGYEFSSDTDTEVVAHLVHYYSAQGHDLLRAVQIAVAELTGAYALAVCSLKEPGRMVVAGLGAPLIIGLGANENIVASDPVSFADITRRVQYLENGDIADIQRSSVHIYNSEGEPTEREVHTLSDDVSVADKGAYADFMQKEIHEQPKVLADTIDAAVTDGISPALFGDTEDLLAQVEAVRFVACGTSNYAGRIGAQWVELIAGVPASIEVASEFRYRNRVANPRELLVSISQSGTTADTLEAMRQARKLGQEWTLSICNVPNSTLPRESRLVYCTRAGVEVGVASTKAFTTQLAALFILALTIAKAKDRLYAADEKKYLGMLRRIPGSVQHALNLEPQIVLWARELAGKEHALYLGRGIHHPIALEGALKLKEISYIHAEAYPAGELKHGPIALVDERMPVIAVAPNDDLFDKIKSNIAEVRARGGQLYVLTDEGSSFGESDGVRVIRVPRHDDILSPIMHTIPVQLLARHTAVLMGRNVDKPRNLAKSVTVE